jgi:hypothetical protein
MHDDITVTSTSAAERDSRSGRFLTGNSGGGRPKGSRNVLGEQFLDDLRETWATHGKTALARCASEEPTQFVRVIASLLPREAQLDVNIGVDIMDFAARFRAAVALLDGADPDAATMSYRHPKLINGR